MLGLIKYIFKYRRRALDQIQLYLSLLGSLLLLFHLGHSQLRFFDLSLADPVAWVFYLLFSACALLTVGSIFAEGKISPRSWSNIGVLVLGLGVLISGEVNLMYLAVFLLTLTEISKNSLFFDSLYFNPTILFVLSFLLLIILGAFLFMLPNSTRNISLSFVDALFMATSAVSITGLSVLDVSSELTRFGQVILLILIQLGGLGILTFTGFFGYFFSGGFSYKNQLMYGQILGQDKIGNVINTLLKIISLTLICEAIGAVIIYAQLPAETFSSQNDRLFVAVFHAVSAFCNAGFSILDSGAQNPIIKFNYGIQLILTCLFLVGGMGFAIFFNLYTYLKFRVISGFRHLFWAEKIKKKPWIFSFNARLMAWTMGILIIVSTVMVLVFEYNGQLGEHQGFLRKLIASIFMGNSARTTGFALGEMQAFSLPLLLIFLILMWIGASPGSTGGGIKTTTFSVALLSIYSLARGKGKVEVFHRKVSNESITKAFAIIVLSLIAIGTCIFLLTLTNGHLSLRAIVFESISAYATCGLSLGVTPLLNDEGKIIITLSMFLGRVGLLTILVALVKDLKNKSYSYPKEQVLF